MKKAQLAMLMICCWGLLGSSWLHAAPTAPRITLLIPSLEQAGPAQPADNNQDRYRSLHAAISASLQEVGLDAAPFEALPTTTPGATISRRDVAIGKAYAAQTDAALVVEKRERDIGPVADLELFGLEVEFHTTLLDGRSTTERNFRVTTQAFGADRAAAREQALRQATRSLAWKLKLLLQPPHLARPPEPAAGTLLIRVRGIERLAELQQLMERLVEAGAGTYTVAGADPGEVHLTGTDRGQGFRAVLAALEGWQAEPELLIRSYTEQNSLLLLIEHPPRPATPPGNLLPGQPTLPPAP